MRGQGAWSPRRTSQQAHARSMSSSTPEPRVVPGASGSAASKAAITDCEEEGGRETEEEGGRETEEEGGRETEIATWRSGQCFSDVDQDPSEVAIRSKVGRQRGVQSEGTREPSEAAIT